MRVLLAVALVIAGFGSTGARVRALTTDADDFAIPAGWFFTEASPDHASGTGFAVQDGHAADLWRAFQAAGGVSVLGYPMSRRFEWDGLVAQAFSSGDTLRWNPDTGEPEVLSTSDLPEGKPPEYALVPDKPPVVSADVQPTPWSGWWWPATGAGPSLFAPNGPLDKYDKYVAAATGNDPGTRIWERQNMYFPTPPWAGHCNGAAAAALVEPEPVGPVTALGVTFSVADLKGLLVDYHFGDAAEWSYGDEGELDPADFQRMLLEWVEVRGNGFVLTFDLGGGEVWSYPVYRFESEWAPDPFRVTCGTSTPPSGWPIQTCQPRLLEPDPTRARRARPSPMT